MGLNIYIEDGSGLPYLIKTERREESSLGTVKHTFATGINYDENISIERPEKVIDQRKVEVIFSKIQDCARELKEILFDYKETNGIFPEKLDPEAMGDIMAANSLEWPANIFTGAPITQKKDSPGDYYYETIDNSTLFKLDIYDYFARPQSWGAETEEQMARIQREMAIVEATTQNIDVFTQEDFDNLTPPHVSSILTESEKAQARAIALNDATVQQKLQNTDYTIRDVYPLYSSADGTIARVVILYFVNPYKIDFGGLSIIVDLKNECVAKVTKVPESICNWLKGQLMYGRIKSLSLTEEESQVVDVLLTDPRVQALVESTEYVITDVRTYNANNVEGIWSVDISFFGPHGIDGFTFPEVVTLGVDLKNGTVISDPMMRIMQWKQPEPQPSESDLPDLTREQQDQALKITLADPRIQELLKGKEYDIWGVGGWYENSGLVGAVLTIYLNQLVIIEYDWPTIKNNKDGTFTEYTYHSAEKVTRLYIRVHLASQKVVEILPMYFP